jgi:hypothetical protein
LLYFFYYLHLFSGSRLVLFFYNLQLSSATGYFSSSAICVCLLAAG